jgi:hypothetical protein
MITDESFLIRSIRQVDGSEREIYAQDERHARHARALLRGNPALVDGLDGLDGIRITVRDVRATRK